MRHDPAHAAIVIMLRGLKMYGMAQGGKSRGSDDTNVSSGHERGGSGNFAENRERASEAGRKGGQH